MLSIDQIYALLDSVMDPEVPVLSILDLGIVRSVKIHDQKKVEINITPTYSGCPAMDVISMQIRMQLLQAGIEHFQLNTVLSPAWTTDWMSESGKQKLQAYGIAPPAHRAIAGTPALFEDEEAIACPHCLSLHTERVSEFGSTACKSLYRCLDCKEPFDHFKCH